MEREPFRAGRGEGQVKALPNKNSPTAGRRRERELDPNFRLSPDREVVALPSMESFYTASRPLSTLTVSVE